MAGFDHVRDADRIDFRLMRRSPVRLFRSRTELDEVMTWQRANGYHVVDVEASWTISKHMFADLASAFPSCCHDNFHCLGEGLDHAIADAPAESAGFVLVLRGFDTFIANRWADAQSLLALICDRAWRRAVIGHRLLCLVQADRPLDLLLVPTWAVVSWSIDAAEPVRPAGPGSSQ